MQFLKEISILRPFTEGTLTATQNNLARKQLARLEKVTSAKVVSYYKEAVRQDAKRGIFRSEYLITATVRDFDEAVKKFREIRDLQSRLHSGVVFLDIKETKLLNHYMSMFAIFKSSIKTYL